MATNKYSDDTKMCPVCKRPFSNRASYAKRGIWDSVIYCSDACRKNKNREK